ncbi:MAG: hypothetical protein P1U85_22955 [Verrucomicrobiales bacterium]|nr:hypothetical protein [Verrucomicrobiales bacterium]
MHHSSNKPTSPRLLRFGTKVAVLLLGFLCIYYTGNAQPDPKEKANAPAFHGTILGMKVDSSSLAVVLDVSESMKRFLPAIQAELRKRTPKNPTLHVDGTGIEEPDPRPRIVNGVAPETITAIDALSTYSTATTILWITDLGDPPNRNGILSLEKLARDRGLQLLLISVKNKPSPSIRKVIESTEGYWEVIDSKQLR